MIQIHKELEMILIIRIRAVLEVKGKEDHGNVGNWSS